MLLSQTPLRISFCGGGTDLPAFYQRAGHGAVLSSAINQYVYLALHRHFHPRYLLKYSKTEDTESVDQIRHPLIRECLLEMDFQDPLELSSFADIPANGSGLGSSSAFCVGLLAGLMEVQGRKASPEELASKACAVELGRLREPIGKQDQYATAFGGLNFLRFDGDGSVNVERLALSEAAMLRLQGNLMLFFTGLTRQASEILTEQAAKTASGSEVYQLLLEMRSLAYELREEFLTGNVGALGELMDQNWHRKKKLAGGISSPELDSIYDRARGAGAIGGKLLGAGGGGFFLFYCSEKRQAEVREALKELRHIPFLLEQQGSRVVFTHNVNPPV